MMFRLRWLRVVNIAVILSLFLQLVAPMLQNRTVSAAPLPPQVVPPPRASQVASAASSDLQTTLNLLVRETIAANGWIVAALTSQMNPISASASQQSGTGQYQVQVLDENQQSLSLAGGLDYQITALTQVDSTFNTQIKLNGTLQTTNVALALDLNTTAENNGATVKSIARTFLKLTRSGKTITTSVNSSDTTQSLAYNLNQSVTHSNFDRDGQTGTSTQTVTMRALGHGESEVWLQLDAQGDVATTSLTQHLFQRMSGARVAQYLDRFDLKTTDNQYALQASSGIIGTLDGELNYAITLGDRNGKTIKLSQGKPPQSFNLPAQRVPGLEMPLASDVDNLGDSRQREFGLSIDAAGGRIDRQLPPAISCGLYGLGIGLLSIDAGIYCSRALTAVLI